MSLTLMPAVATASEVQPTARLAARENRPVTLERAGRSYFRIRTMAAQPVAPARVVSHPARPVVAMPKKVVEAARKPRPPRQRAPRPPAVQLPVVPASGLGAAVARWALTQVGKRYVYGTSGPSSYDCSGLSMAAWLRVGIRLPHNADAQRRYGRPVSRAQLQPGDLVFYPGHVGIAVGGGMMVAAATPSEGVKFQRIYGTPSAYRRLG